MAYTLDRLRAAIDDEVAEHRHLEYKETLEYKEVGGKIDFDKEAKKEFLRDVAAMASAGGDIIVGVKTKRDEDGKDTGIPESLSPIPYQSSDALVLTIENLIRDGLRPRIFNVDVRALEPSEGQFIIAISTPRSLFAPHMVVAGGDFRCYHRTSAGKVKMDADDLRNAFLQSAGYLKEAKDWRDGRLKDITNQVQHGYNLNKEPIQIIHLIPLGGSGYDRLLAVKDMEQQKDSLDPYDTDGKLIHRYNADGFRCQSGTTGYVQLYRTGRMECARTLEKWPVSIMGLQAWSLEKSILNISAYLRAMQNLGITPPILISCSYSGVHDYFLGNMSELASQDDAHRFFSDTFTLPEILLEEWLEQSDLNKLVRPLIDMVWNAAGYEASPNFDQNGNHVASRKRQ